MGLRKYTNIEETGYKLQNIPVVVQVFLMTRDICFLSEMTKMEALYLFNYVFRWMMLKKLTKQGKIKHPVSSSP